MFAEIDTKTIECALEVSPEFKKLYSEHQTLGKKLAKMSKSPHLSPVIEDERKRLQKVKLAGKDRMVQIVKRLSRSN